VQCFIRIPFINHFVIQDALLPLSGDEYQSEEHLFYQGLVKKKSKTNNPKIIVMGSSVLLFASAGAL